jgi:hypothetical protein
MACNSIGLLPAVLVATCSLAIAPVACAAEKTETFDRDPGWIGVNNRSAQAPGNQRTVRQDFGWTATNHAGGQAGEAGGFISPAGDVAFYGAPIAKATFDQKLSASGTMFVAPGGTHLLLGFFNAAAAKEWRTNSTISLRIQARGPDRFFAYVEYCTSKWRAGGDSTPFPSAPDPKTGRSQLIGFPTGKALKWMLTYDPEGNDGRGIVTATIDGKTAICNVAADHKADGARFDHFGIMNVAKSADVGSEFYIDDLTVNGNAETFDRDPKWDGKNNRVTYTSKLVRPRFDFGFSPTHFAGGANKGELGGQIFRGDCRHADRLASYGDAVGPLTLDKPLRASGKIALARGVTDSTTLLGFYSSKDSLRVNDSQNESIPESVLGIHVEGPSDEGFLLYPVWRTKGGGGEHGRIRGSQRSILPNGASHDWALEYKPRSASGAAQATITFDGKSETCDLKSRGDATTTFDRFGIVTSWIDGNSQDVYWDDLTYTVSQE